MGVHPHSLYYPCIHGTSMGNLNCDKLWFRSGVSNTQPAGRMWPAWRVYAARVIIKIPLIIVKTTVLCGIRALFTSFCGPRKHFCLLVRPARSVFIKMWPAYIVEFETPGLKGLKFSLKYSFSLNSVKFASSFVKVTHSIFRNTVKPELTTTSE